MATGDRVLKVTILGDAKGAQQAFSDTESSAGGLASKLGGLVTGLGGGLAIFDLAAGGLERIGGAVSSLIGPAAESQQIEAQTAAVIKSTGDASGLTAEQFKALASAQETNSTFSRDTIEQGENMLATFTGIGKTTFPDATAAVDNMTQSFQAAGKNMNISDVAILVGKALNDPVQGLTALHRVGVSFSDDQKKVIAQLVKTGDVAGAQKVILAELNTEFGGSAAAAADTYSGKMTILHNKLNDAKIALGEAIIPLLSRLGSAVLPIVISAFDKLPGLIERIQTGLAPVVATLAPAFKTIATLIGDIVSERGDLGVFADDLHELFGIDITPIVTGLRAVEATVRSTFDTIRASIEHGQLREIFQSVFGFLVAHKDDVVAALAGLTIAFGVWTVATWAQAAAMGALNIAMSPITAVVLAIAGVSILLYEAWKNNFGGIQQKTEAVVVWLRDTVPPAFEAIKTAFLGVVDFFKNLVHGDWSAAWDDLKGALVKAKDWLVTVGLPDLWTALKTFFLETLPKIELQLLDWGLAFVRWVAPQIPPLLVEMGKLLDQLGGWIINTALPDIGTKLLEWGKAFIAWVGPQIPPLLLELGKLELELVKWVLLTALPDIIAQLVQWGLAFVAWVAPHIADLLIELGKLELQVAQWIILTALPDIIKQLVQWGGAFVGWVAGATTDLLNALPGLASSVITWIGNQADPTQSGTIAAKMLDAGKTAGTSLVDGILGGIKAAWHTLTDWLSQNPLNVVSKLIGGGGGPPAASSSGSAGSPPGGIAAEGARIIAMAETTAGAYGWCEKFVGDTMDRMGLHYTRALSAQAHSTMQPLNPGLGPEGAIVFYPWGSEGHVAFSMGDGQHIYGTLDTPSGTGESNGYWAQPYGWTVNPAMNGLFVKGGPALVLSNENPGNHEGEVTAPVPMLRGVVRDELKKALKGGGGSGMSVHLHGDLHVQQAPGATDQLLDALLARL